MIFAAILAAVFWIAVVLLFSTDDRRAAAVVLGTIWCAGAVLAHYFALQISWVIAQAILAVLVVMILKFANLPV